MSVAESYHFTPGNTAPAIFTIDLKPPKTVRGPDWAPEPNFTRPIPITASICLDFSSSSTFEHLESRPALILAPASTWHTGIGYAMWEQAKARAAETGSPIVWCDGGEGGVGGIVGGGYNEIVQVGEGSWTKSIGIEWPFNERRTSFQVRGKSWALSIVWAVVGAGWVVERIAATGARRRYYSTSAVSFVFQWIDRVRDLRRGRVVLVDEEQDLLH